MREHAKSINQSFGIEYDVETRQDAIEAVQWYRNQLLESGLTDDDEMVILGLKVCDTVEVTLRTEQFIDEKTHRIVQIMRARRVAS